MRCRVYIRLSQLREGQEKTSPQIQMEAARRFCESRGWTLDEEASLARQDLDESGYSKGWERRAGLARHVADMRAGQFDILIAMSFDRLGRNLLDSLKLVEAVKSAAGRIITINDSVDTGNPETIFHMQLMGSLAERESLQISQRMKRSRTARAEQGRWLGGRLPCWLKKSEDGFIPHEPYWSLYQTIAAMRIGGASWREITHFVNAQGITNASGGTYEMTTFSRLFGTPEGIRTLAGDALVKRGTKGEAPQFAIGAFPKLITEDQQAALMKLAQWREKRTITGRDRASERWILNGMITCACGSKCRTHIASRAHEGRGNQQKRTYICSRQLHDPQPDHGPAYVDADSLEFSVLAPLWILMDESDEFDPLWTALDIPDASVPAKRSPMPAKPKTRTLNDIQAEADRLMTRYGRGAISDNAIDRRLAELQAEADGLRKQPELPPVVIEVGTSKLRAREALKRLQVQVMYPVFNEAFRLPRTGELRRCVQIKLSLPSGDWEFLVPLYRSQYRGAYHLLDRTFDGWNGPYQVPDYWIDVIKTIVDR